MDINPKGLFTPIDYGSIHIKLKDVLESRKITRNKLSVLTGVHYDIVLRYYNDALARVDLDILSKFCCCLQCDITDLLEYIQHEGQ